MKVVTRHLAKEILISTAFVLFALIALFAFFDLVGQLKRIGKDYSFLMAVWFTMTEMPTRIYEVMPIAALLGAVFTLSRWAATSEFTILRTAGLSPLRLAVMLTVPGLIMIASTYFLGEYVAPAADQYRLNLRTAVLDRTLTAKGYASGVWVKDLDRDAATGKEIVRFVNVRNLIAGQDSKTGAWRVFEFGASGDLTRVFHAKSADYANKEGWKLNDARVEHIPAITKDEQKTDAAVRVEQEPSLLLKSELTPAILGVLTIKPESMGISELSQYLDHLKENHQATRRYEIALWSKIFYPLAIFVMLAVAMPFGYLNARSGGVSIKIFVGLMIGISFYTLNNIFSFLGVLHTWPPVVTAITPTVLMLIFATIAMWLVERR